MIKLSYSTRLKGYSKGFVFGRSSQEADYIFEEEVAGNSLVSRRHFGIHPRIDQVTIENHSHSAIYRNDVLLPPGETQKLNAGD